MDNEIPNGFVVIMKAYNIKTVRNVIHTSSFGMEKVMNKPENTCL